MEQSSLTWIDRMKDKNIMVIGDMIADSYLEGKISRISREAPVLILEHKGEKVVPGGAANVVNNTAALGGRVYAVGFLGDDLPGSLLVKELMRAGANTAGLFVDPARPTISKQRIMAGGLATVRQQVVRIDRESKEPLAAGTEEKLLNYIQIHLPSMAAVILSDYGCQTVTPKIRKAVIERCNEQKIPCMVDSRYDILSYPHIGFVKQNESEAAAALGMEVILPEQFPDAGRKLLQLLQARCVLITRGADGMTLFEQNGQVTHIPVTNVSEVYDVSGAGDTVVVTMMLAVAAGAAPSVAARIANYAAGVVVRKSGTATTTPQELKNAIGADSHEND